MQVLKENSIYSMNYENKTDGLLLLKDIKDDSVKITIFDPEYSGAAGHNKYGNAGKKRQKARYELKQMSTELIREFVREIYRVTKPAGYLMLWMDKYQAFDNPNIWTAGTDFERHDVLVWDKVNFGMGRRTRSQSEYLLIYQKAPFGAGATWKTKPAVPDVWSEKIPYALHAFHPHTKPQGLLERLIGVTTDPGDVICDPAAGSYTTLKACRAVGRDCICGDIDFGYAPGIDDEPLYILPSTENKMAQLQLRV